MSAFGKRTIKVQGEPVDLDVKADLPITNLDKDMDQVASHMGWWGSVLGAAERERVQADSHYRHWRGQAWMAAYEGKPKPPPEHVIKATVESDPKFLQYKEAIALSEENVAIARAVFEAFSKKANVLQSKGARMRAEIGAQGMTTPEEPKPAPRTKTAEPAGESKATAGVDRMKDINRKKRTKGK